MLNKYGINRTWLKIIALIVMTIDHIGYIFFPHNDVFRMIGRIAMPLFAYMIAEGCFYTKNRIKYFFTIFILGIICLFVYKIAMNQWYFCVLLVFSVSIGLIYSYDFFKFGITKFKEDKLKSILIIISSIIIFSGLIVITIVLSYPKEILHQPKIVFDYKIIGAFSPFIIYLGFKNKYVRFILFCITVILGSIYFEFINPNHLHQFYSLISIPILFLYNNKKGKISLKYFFYLYYPLHLVALQGLYMIITMK